MWTIENIVDGGYLAERQRFYDTHGVLVMDRTMPVIFDGYVYDQKRSGRLEGARSINVRFVFGPRVVRE